MDVVTPDQQYAYYTVEQLFWPHDAKIVCTVFPLFSSMKSEFAQNIGGKKGFAQ